MANSATNVLEELVAAIDDMNEALARPQDGRKAQIRVIRRLSWALSGFAKCEQLWSSFYDAARDAELDSPGALVPKESFELISTVLERKHADLLVRLGWTPPPSAHELARNTLEAVLAQNGLPIWEIEHIAAARGALIIFSAETRKHLRTGGASVKDLLKDMKLATASAVLVAAVGHFEVETGDKFDINIGASVKDGVTVTVTASLPVQLVPQLLNNHAMISLHDALIRIGPTPEAAPGLIILNAPWTESPHEMREGPHDANPPDPVQVLNDLSFPIAQTPDILAATESAPSQGPTTPSELSSPAEAPHDNPQEYGGLE